VYLCQLVFPGAGYDGPFLVIYISPGSRVVSSLLSFILGVSRCARPPATTEPLRH
jgi:hypothetical protein